MNNHQNTGTDSNSSIRDNSDIVAQVIADRIEREAAQKRSCSVAGCDGALHEPDPAEDMHRVRKTTFDGGEVELEIHTDAGSTAPLVASIWLGGDYSALDADALRSLATVYDSLPTLMREYADKLDELNATA